MVPAPKLGEICVPGGKGGGERGKGGKIRGKKEGGKGGKAGGSGSLSVLGPLGEICRCRVLFYFYLKSLNLPQLSSQNHLKLKHPAISEI